MKPDYDTPKTVSTPVTLYVGEGDEGTVIGVFRTLPGATPPTRTEIAAMLRYAADAMDTTRDGTHTPITTTYLPRP